MEDGIRVLDRVEGFEWLIRMVWRCRRVDEGEGYEMSHGELVEWS